VERGLLSYPFSLQHSTIVLQDYGTVTGTSAPLLVQGNQFHFFNRL
jgi:hypothetical protein